MWKVWLYISTQSKKSYYYWIYIKYISKENILRIISCRVACLIIMFNLCYYNLYTSKFELHGSWLFLRIITENWFLYGKEELYSQVKFMVNLNLRWSFFEPTQDTIEWFWIMFYKLCQQHIMQYLLHSCTNVKQLQKSNLLLMHFNEPTLE